MPFLFIGEEEAGYYAFFLVCCMRSVCHGLSALSLVVIGRLCFVIVALLR